MQGHPYAWKAWRDTIIVVVVVIAIGSLASANPSLRPPRGPHESVLFVPTGAGGPTGLSGPTGATGATGAETEPETKPAGEGVSPPDGPDFTTCEGLTGLDNAICRHEALLAVHPDNHGLQNSLAHLLELKAEHETETEHGNGEHAPPGNGSSSSAGHGQGHGQSDESHGNASGHGQSDELHGNAGGNGKDNGKDH